MMVESTLAWQQNHFFLGFPFLCSFLICKKYRTKKNFFFLQKEEIDSEVFGDMNNKKLHGFKKNKTRSIKL